MRGSFSRALGVCIALFAFATAIANLPIAAAQILITPNPANLTIRAGEAGNVTVTVTNTHPFVISDLEFSNAPFLSVPLGLSWSANESKTITLGVAAQQARVETISSTVSFKYVIDLPTGIRTHQINITPDRGFSPDTLTIRKGDTIVWVNQAQETRKPTSASFAYVIPANQTQSHTFTSVGTINYQDLTTFFAGTIVVINETSTEKVHNPGYDVPWSLAITATLNPTTLAVENSQSDYNVAVSGSKEGLLTIKNTGNERAQSISLSATPNWIKFDENAFDLDSGDQNLVTYHVEPAVFETNETNKTHTVTISIKGVNTDTTTHSLTVFVPFSNAFDDITTNEGFLVFFARYCEQNPTLIVCNNTIGTGGNGTVVVRDLEIPVNLSGREVLATLSRIQRLEDSNERTANDVKEVNELITQLMPQIFAQINQSNVRTDEQEKKSTSKERAFWVVLIFGIIITGIVVVGLVLRRYYYKKSLRDGGYTPNWGAV